VPPFIAGQAEEIWQSDSSNGHRPFASLERLDITEAVHLTPGAIRASIFACAKPMEGPMRKTENLGSDLLIGAREIAEKGFGRDEKWLRYQIKAGNLEFKRLGRQFIARRSELAEKFGIGSGVAA
jgi:hypothetical protein